MTGYQKLKKEVEELSKLWRIAYEAMNLYASQCKTEITKKDLIIINALNEAGRQMIENGKKK